VDPTRGTVGFLWEFRPPERQQQSSARLLTAVESPERLKEIRHQAVEISIRFSHLLDLLDRVNDVEWCFPPKLRPISGSDACVSVLQRYIAICRGSAIDFELFFDFSSNNFSW
jgi:hypothetical protein